MFSFITKRPLWFNILVGILLAVGIFYVFLFSLKWITHHGSSRIVPDVVGKKFDEAGKELHKLGFEIEIQDSIYIDTVPPLTVIKQFPEGDATVKVNRSVYLTISRSVPPEVEMPNLIGYSFRSAEMVLKNMSLRIGDTIFKPDFAKNSVLEQSVSPGTKLRMGTLITLVLGDGIGRLEFEVPDIIGMKYSDARKLIEANGLILGSLVATGEISDTLNAYIWKQNPEKFDEDKKILRIRSGQMMDIWIQMEKPVIDSINLQLHE